MTAQAPQERLTRPQKRPGWMRHFANPEGFVGGLIGHLMARKNALFNRAAVELLDVQPDDNVLEIGFGPGTAVAMLAGRTPRGTVTGVDISATMLRQASRRNRRLIAAERVTLRQAAAERLPFGDGSFDCVLAVNNFHIWPDRAAALGEILRVLKPGGRILLAVRGAVANAGKYTPPGIDEEALRRAVAELDDVGFVDVTTQRVAAGRELIAIKGKRASISGAGASGEQRP